MHGIKAYLLPAAFLFVAALFLRGLVGDWTSKMRRRGRLLQLIGITAFILLWFFLGISTFVREALFLHELAGLKAAEVYEIKIGRHDFKDRATIEDVVNALRDSRWFQVNHGGWGDSIPLTVSMRSGPDLVIDVALYFREPAAVVGPARRRGLGYSPTVIFVPNLPGALKNHGVRLPNCDSAHGRLCTAAQLDP